MTGNPESGRYPVSFVCCCSVGCDSSTRLVRILLGVLADGSGLAEVLMGYLFLLVRCPYRLSPIDDLPNSSWINRLGSVLTVEEAADWVTHAVQLPPEVAEAFRSNAVSGYDFPELVEDNGAGLYFDLGIKRNYRKRIVKVGLVVSVDAHRSRVRPGAVSRRSLVSWVLGRDWLIRPIAEHVCLRGLADSP